VVEAGAGTGGHSGGGRSGKRRTLRDVTEQFRIDRHQELLATALRIVTDEGLPALTMTRLANELEYSVGTVYRHFSSKEALVAEVERAAVDLIGTSFRLSLAHLDELLTTRDVTDPALASLARVVTAIRFWIGADDVVPQEVHLLRRVFTDPGAWIADAGADRVIPAAVRLLDLARGLLDDAVDTGALREGPSLPRAVTLIAGTTGVLMSNALGPWDDDEIEGRDIAITMADDLLISWGAAVEAMAAVGALVTELDAAGHLTPRVR
jgi:AcrR family transcriptional regulator